MGTREAVAGTGLLVAAIRARESTRDDRLFTDPFADKLAGAAGHRILDAALATSGERTTLQIVVRTRFWDDALFDAARSCRQIVLVAAGMDARAYRLDWPAGTTASNWTSLPSSRRRTGCLPTTPRSAPGCRSASTSQTTGRLR
jgi:O-methyltransferase involved in polyketide biosynthesis